MQDACALQFTGGRDSTLTAIRLIEANAVNSLHLLTFQTDLTAEAEAVLKNVKKLQVFFVECCTINHHFINTNDLLRHLVQDEYFLDVWKYKTYKISTFCPSCRLSHHANTIIFCKRNNLMHAADGVNELTGFDLFQQSWAVEKIKELYAFFGIQYETPLLHSNISSEILLEKYNRENNLDIPFFESQPKCLGGGQFHNIYLRCYYLPLYGKDKYIEISKRWIDDKMPIVKDYIQKRILGG